MTIRNVILLFNLVLFVIPGIQSQTETELEHLDAYYEQALKEWDVPGMAIAIVHNDKIIFEKGYGYADIESRSPVDEHTLFAVASNTKAMTASALAILVQQGKLNWNDKVQDHLPWFEMKDPYVSREMTVEDMLCHRSGLKTFSGDLLWYGSDKSAKEVVRAARHLEPAYGFRERYGYSNIMYMAAGLIIEELTGTSFTESINNFFLAPLSMDRSIFQVDKLPEMTNVATPYYIENDETIALEWLNWDNIAAAGGLISSAYDMSKWLMLNINRGSYNEEEYISDNNFERMTTPYMSFRLSRYTRDNQPTKHFRGYGLGWSLQDYHGKKIISHGGGYDGMISRTFVVPEAGLGMVILTNSLNYLTGALMEKTLDVMLGKELDGLDYAGLYKQSFLNSQEKRKENVRSYEENRCKINSSHLSLDSYTGLFRDKMYGDLKVWEEEGKLHFQMIPTQIFQAELSHWNDHIFTFRFDPHLSSLPHGKLWFHIDEEGNPASVLIEVENPDFDFREFEFVRVKE